MGLRETLRSLAGYSTVDQLMPVRSPWTTEQLQRIVLSDIDDTIPATITRSAAMRVPAIVRGRALIAGLLARHPLAVYETATGTKLPDESPWLTTTATSQSPRQRNLWTFDDLIFTGLSLWFVARDGDAITDAIRVDPTLWHVDRDTREVKIQGVPNLSTEQVILFEGPQEGLVTIARDTIQAALDLESAWAKRVAAPVPLLELHSTDSTYDLDKDEAQELVNNWEKQRKAGGGTAYTPASIQAKVLGEAVADLFIQGRNALRLDVATSWPCRPPSSRAR